MGVEADVANEFISAKVGDGASMEPPAGDTPTDPATTEEAPVKVRTNLNETVFFFPDLRTDEEGNVIIKLH